MDSILLCRLTRHRSARPGRKPPRMHRLAGNERLFRSLARIRMQGAPSLALRLARRQSAIMAEREEGSARSPAAASIPGVRHILAVASAKGGVGKSTVAVNLALALQHGGCHVGLLDADIYGPSAPMMLGVEEGPTAADGNRIKPAERYGISVVSMGFFLGEETPVVWRGPLAMSATKQFLHGVMWGELDFLVVDLPPGTGDIALTLAQEVPLSGGIVVTTPQDVALADVRRGVAMLRQVEIPIIGIIDNMCAYVCERCGTRDEIFGARSPEALEAALGAPVLAAIPLVASVCQYGDRGTPIVAAEPGSPVAEAFVEAAERVRAAVEDMPGAGTGLAVTSVENAETEGLVRIFWQDGHLSEYPLAYLRGWCPCAECQGHGGRRHFVRCHDPKLMSWSRVGVYAIGFVWRDGHSTGIYSHGYLRELCACPLCKPEGVSEDTTG